MQTWDTKIGEDAPAFIKYAVKKAFFLNNPEKTEIKVRRRTYLATFQPVPEKEEVVIHWFDITSQKRLQKKVRIKERQHDTLRKLSALAFRCKSLQGFMDKTVELVTETLALEHSRILELQPDGNLLLKAGQGWKADAVGKPIDGSKNSQAGYTLFSKTLSL